MFSVRFLCSLGIITLSVSLADKPQLLSSQSRASIVASRERLLLCHRQPHAGLLLHARANPCACYHRTPSDFVRCAPRFSQSSSFPLSPDPEPPPNPNAAFNIPNAGPSPPIVSRRNWADLISHFRLRTLRRVHLAFLLYFGLTCAAVGFGDGVHY